MKNSINLMINDIKSKEDNQLTFYDKCLGILGPVPKGRIVHFYGPPDCGKSILALHMMINNPDKAFIYVNKSLDDIRKTSHIDNCYILNTNTYEICLSYLESIKANVVDVVVIDNIHNMLSEQELYNGFDKNTDNRLAFEKYIKRLGILCAQKNFVLIINNSINIEGKSRYKYIIENEAIANYKIEKLNTSCDYVNLKFIPSRNIMNDIKMPVYVNIDLKVKGMK